jgi:hypothetical protein
MVLKTKSFLPLVAGKSYRTYMGHVVQLEQSTDPLLVYFRSGIPNRPLAYWRKNTGVLEYKCQDIDFGDIIGFADDPAPSLKDMLKECLE